MDADERGLVRMMDAGSPDDHGAAWTRLLDQGEPRADPAAETTDRDDALRGLVLVARRALAVPVAELSILTEEYELTIRSERDVIELTDVPDAASLCRRIAGHGRSVVVTDASRAREVRASPEIQGGAVAYAGVPIVLDERIAIGAICVTDVRPREWDVDDLVVLEHLATIGAAIVDGSISPRVGMRDGLTGLINRRLFDELLARALDRVGLTAVVALDLDGFRVVNEALGHAAGDALLRAAADRLRACLRPGDAVCRTDGDRFLTVCELVSSRAEADAIALRLRATLTEEPFVVGAHRERLTASVGVAVANGRRHPEEVVDAALDSLRESRERAGRDVHAEQSTRRRHASQLLKVRVKIAGAHERGEISIAYQPLVDLSTAEIVRVEALARWEHPELGTVPPDVFIPVAETTGTIVELGGWVLDHALEALAGWRTTSDLRVAVNVAPAQLRVAAFVDVVADALRRHELPPRALTLEITERTLLDSRPAHVRSLARLSELGVELALDDFGTGYSSLEVLGSHRLDVLKLDRAFVRPLPSDHRGLALVRGIVAMADGLQLDVVAEGVETVEQRDVLRGLGCRLAQGYLFSKPLHPEELTRRLRGR